MCTGEPKIRVTHFIAIFALLQWSGTEPAVSPRPICTFYLDACVAATAKEQGQ